MTATVLPLPAEVRVSAGPCGSGATPGQVTAPCGVTEGSRPFPTGVRCPAHFPINRKTGRRDAA